MRIRTTQKNICLWLVLAAYIPIALAAHAGMVLCSAGGDHLALEPAHLGYLCPATSDASGSDDRAVAFGADSRSCTDLRIESDLARGSSRPEPDAPSTLNILASLALPSPTSVICDIHRSLPISDLADSGPSSGHPIRSDVLLI